MNKKRILSAVVSAALLFTSLFSAANLPAMTATAAAPKVESLNSSDLLDSLMDTATSFITVKHYQLGGSHYAYTEYINEYNGNGANWVEGPENGFYKSGSQLILVELEDKGNSVEKTETVLIDSPSGMIRDPDVSADGKDVIFSWKQSNVDDFHLYRANIEALRKDSAAYKQITFGSGDTQTEPKFLPNGNIIFSCSKITQTIDCWHIPVSNLYICGPNGENMVRVGYDQVHTTYPTVTEDGRVLYTRWDYNDRNQMYIQGVFQMQADGTNQTEVYGNDANWPTTLLHTREIPGTSDKYIAIGSGHHTRQLGKLMIIDTSKGRNSVDAVDYVFPNENGNTPKTSASVDNFGQNGPMYKYPYALNENEFLVAYAPGGRQGSNDLTTPFSIYLMNTSGEKIKLVDGTSGIPASQIVPIKNRSMFVRPSMVNYASDTGTYYMGNVYEGEGMKGVKKGDAKQLRVVALDYRSYAIGATQGSGTGSSDPYTPIATGNGAWDVKRVLGVVDIEEDGSALFKVPANTPIYFQVLDEKGEVIQTMRSWSTVMPNETFSCVGCHEDKNTVPPASSGVTMAMNKGVQEIRPESWQDPDLDPYDPYGSDNAFSYLEKIQPILDESCVSCHSNIEAAYDKISLDSSSGNSSDMPSTIIPQRDEWKYTTSRPSRAWNTEDFDDSEWAASYAPFGTDTTAPGSPNTIWDTQNIWMRQTVHINKAQLEQLDLYLQVAGNEAITVYFNGEQVYNSTSATTDYKEIAVTDSMKAELKLGENVIAVMAVKGSSGQYADVGMIGKIHRNLDDTESLFKTGETWKYTTSASNNVAAGWNGIDFDDRSWKSGQTPIGDRGGEKTRWDGSNVYLWARKEFTLTRESWEELKGAILTVNTWYDDDPVFYINGHQVYSDPGKWVDKYTEKRLSDEVSDYLVEGKNVFAVSLHQHEGGRMFDLGLTAKKNQVNEKILLNPSSDGWKYTINDMGYAMDEKWIEAGFNDSSWNSGRIDGVKYDVGKQIWARTTFTLDDASGLDLKKLFLNIKYDENPQIYLNGNLIFSAEGFYDKYHTESLLADYTKYLKRGENTIAVTAFNTDGGSCIDFGISMRDLQTPVSFEGTNVVGERQRKFWPLSYLVLTASSPSGNNWKANTTNNITNWVSSMSQCEILEPRQYGAVKSNIMTMLREKHQGVELTDEQLRTIAAWIDLGVPCYGSYDENNNWDGNSMREATEKDNKRAFNDMVNEQHMKALAGAQQGGEISVSFSGGGNTYSDKQNGFVELTVPQKYQNGDTVTVKLPEGQKYLMFSLSSRVGESLIYVPSGTFTYTLKNLDAVFPTTVQPSKGVAYIENTITARLATSEDLNTRRNLARNSYDLKSATTAYPHVTTSTDCRNSAEFEGRNAIDGFTANKGHGTYPYQSWGPELQRDDPFEKQNLKVDFGREVYADEVRIYIRADFPHDTYYASATLEFSDGTTEDINLRQTADAQVFTFEPRKTSYVKIKNLRVVDHAGDDWAGITEFEVYGTESEVIPDQVDWTLDAENKTVSGMEAGITVADFIEGFHGAEVKVTDAAGKAVSSSALLGTGMKAAYNGVTYIAAIPGDLNGDGQVNITDVMETCKILARKAANKQPTPVELLAADLTKSDGVTISDVMEICKILARKA